MCRHVDGLTSTEHHVLAPVAVMLKLSENIDKIPARELQLRQKAGYVKCSQCCVFWEEGGRGAQVIN
jgi:hypothetical protein